MNESKNNINFNDFSLLKQCSRLLKSVDESEQMMARELIIQSLESRETINKELICVWDDLIESAGFYPYLKKENISIEGLQSEIRKNYYLSEYREDIIYHKEQKNIISAIDRGENLIVSAPTSFGKSLLIEEVIASKKFNNIVVIQPTIALLDETRRKLTKYNDYYKIIIRTTQEPSSNHNIFLFTAERVMEYDKFFQVDFLVIDEFYKLSANRDDERSDSLNNAFYKVYSQFRPQFYMLGPNIDKISEGFLEKYKVKFYKTDYSLVLNQSIDYFSKNKDKFGSRGSKAEFKKETLFNLLVELNGQQSIIYCSSPGKVKKLAREFTEYLANHNVEKRSNELPINNWISTYVDSNWSILKSFNYRVGIHDGSLPKHITSSIIEYFNNGFLNYLFCTTTIIEGVNTTTKNIVYFDNLKGGSKPIDYFDYSNIKGRAGRMMVHYVGKIYNFNKVPAKESIEIDIPIYDQKPITDEVLIHLNKTDVNCENLSRYMNFDKLPIELKRILQKNGVSINGQLKILELMKSNFDDVYGLINWNGYPTYRQLEYALSICWNHLLKEGETTKPMTDKKLVFMTFNYGQHKSIKRLIEENYQYRLSKDRKSGKSDIEIRDSSISEVYQTLRHWFGYKVPKWLSVLNNLQKYICELNHAKAGDYLYYSNEIENEFIPHNLSLLLEYGIPNTTIVKLSKLIPNEMLDDEILTYIKENKLFLRKDLLKYEEEKLSELINN